MDSSVMPPTSTSRARSYSPGEWNDKRPFITQLYRQEGRKLRDVRSILASEHGFQPTDGMLKKRIKAWGLDRKKKESEMLEALRIAFQRETRGKQTVFFIRQQPITFPEIERYFRRKGIKDLRSLVAGTEAVALAVPIRACTPEPDRATDEHATFGTSNRGYREQSSSQKFQPEIFASNILPVVAVPNPFQVDPFIRPNSSIINLEKIIHNGYKYYDFALSSPNWKTDRESMKLTFDLGPIEAFYHDFYNGQGLLERSPGDVRAFKYFDRAFSRVSLLLSEHLVIFLPYVYNLLLQFKNARGQEVISLLLKYIVESGNIGAHDFQRHGIRQSMHLLHGMSPHDRAESSERALISLVALTRAKFDIGPSMASSSVISRPDNYLREYRSHDGMEVQESDGSEGGSPPAYAVQTKPRLIHGTESMKPSPLPPQRPKFQLVGWYAETVQNAWHQDVNLAKFPYVGQNDREHWTMGSAGYGGHGIREHLWATSYIEQKKLPQTVRPEIATCSRPSGRPRLASLTLLPKQRS